MTTPALTTSITATGVANAVVYSLDPAFPEGSVLLTLSGPFLSAAVVFEAQPRGGAPTWGPLGALSLAGGVMIRGTPAPGAAYLLTPDATPQAFRLDMTNYQALRVWASGWTSGPITCNFAAGSWFVGGPLTT
jgi:hypothetical protein